MPLTFVVVGLNDYIYFGLTWFSTSKVTMGGIIVEETILGVLVYRTKSSAIS